MFHITFRGLRDDAEFYFGGITNYYELVLQLCLVEGDNEKSEKRGQKEDSRRGKGMRD